MTWQKELESKEVVPDYKYQPPKDYQTDYLPIKKRQKHGTIK